LNWSVIIPIGLVGLLIIVWLTWKNLKDEKKVVDQMKDEYPISKEEEHNTDTEEEMK
jgi:hypothetical protein